GHHGLRQRYHADLREARQLAPGAYLRGLVQHLGRDVGHSGRHHCQRPTEVSTGEVASGAAGHFFLKAFCASWLSCSTPCVCFPVTCTRITRRPESRRAWRSPRAWAALSVETP